MSINAIVELCLKRAGEAGLSPQKQDEAAAQLLREIRPEWSDSQIDDTISRVRDAALSAPPAAGGLPNGSSVAA